jgi:hypothetical protein
MVTCFGPQVRQKSIMAESCSPHGGQEAERDKKGWGQDISFNGMPLVTNFPNEPPLLVLITPQ